MRLLKGIARMLCTLMTAISAFYTVTSLAIAVFIATGTLTEGDTMWIDTNTPQLSEALLTTALCALLTGVFAYARHRLRATEPA